MKRIKGSALLWCLSVLIVLAVITMTAVMLSVRYYRNCVKNAGNSQAYYNSEAAAKLLVNRLESKLGEKQVYFTYSGNDLLDNMSSTRNTDVSQADTEYFGDALDEDLLKDVRALENELITEYIKNNGKERTPLKITYNYGKLDSSVFSHGYYGDTAEIYIDSITEYDSDGDDEYDSYIALVKAKTTLNTGYSSSVGARFILNPAVFNADRLPAVSCGVMDIGVPESEAGSVYDSRNGILLGLYQDSDIADPYVIVSGDSSAPDMAEWGFIRTDGIFALDEESGTEKLFDELSYLDSSNFKIISKNSGTDKFLYLHDSFNMMFSEEYTALRGFPDHSFDAANILNDDTALALKVRIDPPKALSAGDKSNNIVKRYYVTGGSTFCYYNEPDGKEYSMSFAEYTDHLKNGTAANGDSEFKDTYNTDGDLICCIVEKRTKSSGGMTINTGEKINLDNIVLEDGKTYFFRICQNTRISFDPSCSGVNADVYFQLYNDIKCGGGQYDIDLTLVNPPENINIFAFDKSEVSTLVSPDNPSSHKNVTIEINDYTPDNYTVSGCFSCYRFSIADRTGAAGVIHKNVKLKTVKPGAFITVFDPKDSSMQENKDYRWIFERFTDPS